AANPARGEGAVLGEMGQEASPSAPTFIARHGFVLPADTTRSLSTPRPRCFSQPSQPHSTSRTCPLQCRQSGQESQTPTRTQEEQRDPDGWKWLTSFRFVLQYVVDCSVAGGRCVRRLRARHRRVFPVGRRRARDAPGAAFTARAVAHLV